MERPSPAYYIEMSLESLKAHNLDAAGEYLDRALTIDYDNKLVLAMLKYVGYWKERQKALGGFQSNFEKSDYLLIQWAQFQSTIDRIGLRDDRVLHAFRHLVFGQSLNFLSVYDNDAGAKDHDVLYRVGVSLKGLGNLQAAQRFLESANSQLHESPQILADLADCYAMMNEHVKARVLFKEAFFIDAAKVRIETLESPLIVNLIRSVSEKYSSLDELKQWIPVHAQLEGVFTIRRELRISEYNALTRSVYQLEREYGENLGDKKMLVPKLLNRYFWLAEHYSKSSKEQARLAEVLLKIKALSPSIWERYTR